MTIPLLCLLAFAAWTGLLVLGVVWPRVAEVLRRQAPASSGYETPRYERLMRAHANCVENLPPFTVVVVVASLTSQGGMAIDALSMCVVVFRVLQTLLHVASGNGAVINLRFACFATQWLCMAGIGGLSLA